jgi:predicted SprT family Zn-dependent metalloprotease
MSTETVVRTSMEIETAIRETGEFYLQLAEELYGKKIKRPEYRFDLKGAVAGYACYGPWAMRFNMHIAKTSGHGPRWKSIMRKFGCEPSRCHSYDQLRTASGQDRPKVICGCGEREIGPIKYKRMIRGESSYTCGRCKQRVKPADPNAVAAPRTDPQLKPLTKRRRKVSVACGCGMTQMGAIQYKRMKEGANYSCRKCKQRVRSI